MDASTPTPRPGHGPADRPRRGRRWTALVVLVALVLVVALGPTILSTGFVRRAVLDYAGRRLGGHVQARSWRLSWFGPQNVSDLAIDAPDGQSAARVASASLDQGILGLVLSGGRLGPVAVEDADLELEGLRKLPAAREEPPAAWPAAEEKPLGPAAAPPIPLKVEVRGLKLRSRGATIRVAQANFTVGADADQFDARLEIQHKEERGTGTVEGTLQGLTSDFKGAEAIGLRANAVTENVPLAAIFDVLAGLDIPIEGGGLLSGTARIDRDRAGKTAVRTDWNGQDLWAAGKALKDDRPRLERLQLTADLEMAGRAVTVRSLHLESPVAVADAKGTFALADPAAKRPMAADGSATLRLEVAPVARMLPNTLGLHKDVEVLGGTVAADLTMKPEGGGDRLAFSADLKDLVGRRQGRPIAVSPIHVEARVLRLQKTTTVEQLVASGAFGRVEGSGRLDAFTMDAQLDLSKAAQELGQFADLGGLGAAGTLTANVRTSGTYGKAMRVEARADAANLALDLGEGKAWREPKASLTAQADLAFDDQERLAAIDAKDVRASLAGGTVAAAAVVTRKAEDWDVRGRARGAGDLGVLARQVSGYLGRKPAEGERTDLAGAWHLDDATFFGVPGKALSASVQARTERLAYVQTKPGGPARATPVEDLSLKADLEVQPAEKARHVVVKALDLTGQGMVVHADGQVTTAAEGGKLLRADAKTDARADLAKAAGLLEAFGLVAPGSHLAGTAAFVGSAATQGAQVVGSGTLTGDNLDIRLADTDTQIKETRVEVPVRATYLLGSGQVQATLDGIASRLAAGSVKGTLTPGQDVLAVDAEADLVLDGARLRAALGNRVSPALTLSDAWRVTGKVAGPVPTDEASKGRRLARLTGSGVVKVGTFTYRDTVGSEGEVRWELGGGKLLLGPDKQKPSQVKVSDGVMTVAGHVDLREDPPRYRIEEPVEVARGVRLTGELARETLIYLSPLVGYSATPTGRLTLRIDRLDVPLAKAAAAETGAVKGRFTVEDFRTRFAGPFALLMRTLGESGEVVQELLGPVPIRFEQGLFHLENQTVYLRKGMPMRLDGTIRASDGALNLMVVAPLTETLLKHFRVPIRAEWMILDKFVRFPMTGTIKSPRYDEKRLGEAVLESIKDIFSPIRRPFQGIGKILEGIGKPEKEPPPEEPPPEEPPPEEPPPEGPPPQRPPEGGPI